MKTRLMLEGSRIERLWIDGPSLVIGMPAMALTRIPLRRLRTVVVLGRLEQGLDALLHCAEQQIPVLFCSKNGSVKSQILPYQRAIFDWDDWLESLSFDAPFRHDYHVWLEDQLQHLRSFIQRDLDPHFDPNQPWRVAMLESSVNFRLKRQLPDGKSLQEAKDWLSGFLRVHANEVLLAHGLKPHQLAAERILADFSTDLLRLARHRQVQWLARQSCPINAKWMSLCYQSMDDELGQHLARICLQLRRLIENHE